MRIDTKYFNKEVTKFQEIMGDKRFTVEQVSDALRGLLIVYMNTKFQNRDEEEKAEHIMEMITVEHDRRLALRLEYNI